MASEKHNFKKGDVVRLKSGGPKMSYTGIDKPDGRLVCQWFDHSGVSKKDAFAAETLEKV